MTKDQEIWFHVVPESKICKNRIHFDLRVSGGYGVPMNIRKERVEAEAERLVKIGATRLETPKRQGLSIIPLLWLTQKIMNSILSRASSRNGTEKVKSDRD
jgi:glyoxalase superfamily protein